MRISNLFSLTIAALCLAAATVKAADAPATFKVGEFTFTRPAAWGWVASTSSMRKAQLKIGDDKTKGQGEVVFFHFGPGQGGGTKANIDRWFGQFVEPRDKANSKTEEVTVGGRKVTYAQAEGTYRSGMPGGPATPLKDHALLGAIVESNEGSVFVRLTGPIGLVKEATPEFRKMIESALK